MDAATLLSYLYPGALIVAGMYQLLSFLQLKRESLTPYLWAAGQAIAVTLGMIWLSTSISSVQNGGLTSAQAGATMSHGIYLFLALMLLVYLKHVVQSISLVAIWPVSKIKHFLGKRG